MDDYQVDPVETLSPLEFYRRYRGPKEVHNSFEEEDKEDEVVEVTQKKVEPRPITPVNLSIKRPPRDHAELTQCFRERLVLRDDLKNVSVEDQTELADVLTMAIVSIWPTHRRQGPDPLLDGGPYHIEISSLICSANQRTGFYTIRTPKSRC